MTPYNPYLRLVSGRCAEVEALQPLEETMEQLGGGEFLEVFIIIVIMDVIIMS